MNNIIKNTLLAALAASFPAFAAEPVFVKLTPEQIPGVSRDANSNTTAGYGSSSVQTQLRLDVKDGTEAVHFIRDNTDPYVITKAYRLKNAAAYAVRGYLLAVVRGTRVAASPVQVDALQFNDGTGLVLVSAEDYRFHDNGKGESIDRIVARLDQPGMAFSSGRPKFIYFPKVNAAATLKEMVRNVGANGNDPEFTSGVDVLLVDGQLNALFVAAPFWSWKHIREMLEQYDRPLPEVRISYRLIEINSENDDKAGVDFQSWKNNDGVDFFSAGGRYRNNWASTFAGNVNGSHSSRTDYFNFNPKWNSKYLDFLSSSGRARVVTEGVLLAKNRTPSSLLVESGVFYDDVARTIPPETLNDKLTDGRPQVPSPGGDLVIQHGKEQNTMIDSGFRFRFEVSPVVTAKSTTLQLAVSGVSLIGWNSDGSPRVSRSTFNTEVQVGNSGKAFVIGGICKAEVVRGTAGLPLLKDLPGLGWLFSTETESTKQTQLVLIARAEYANPFDSVNAEITDNIGKIVDDIQTGMQSPVNNLGFQQLLLDTDKIQ